MIQIMKSENVRISRVSFRNRKMWKFRDNFLKRIDRSKRVFRGNAKV